MSNSYAPIPFALALFSACLPAVHSQELTQDAREVLRDGDIVLHKSQSAQSQALRAATGSPYTHVGIVFTHEGSLQVLEAVQPVRWTPLDEWAARGADAHIVVARVPNISPDEVTAVRDAASAHLGVDYDLLFEWSDDRIYCSELVYKAFEQGAGRTIGERETFADLDLSSGAVQELIATRTEDGIDATETVVTPVSILRDDEVQIVFSSDPDVPVTLPAVR